MSKRNVSVYMDEATVERMEALAQVLRRSKSNVVMLALEAYHGAWLASNMTVNGEKLMPESIVAEPLPETPAGKAKEKRVRKQKTK